MFGKVFVVFADMGHRRLGLGLVLRQYFVVFGYTVLCLEKCLLCLQIWATVVSKEKSTLLLVIKPKTRF